jgi:hypothetical protein
VGDIFVLFLVARHREKAGHIEEMAIGVVDSGYSTFLFYEALGEFLKGVSDAPDAVAPPAAEATAAPSLSLKRNVKRFVPPEAVPPKEDEDTGSD